MARLYAQQQRTAKAFIWTAAMNAQKYAKTLSTAAARRKGKKYFYLFQN
jgi:hypothetical protein